jgi:hypothetical protein
LNQKDAFRQSFLRFLAEELNKVRIGLPSIINNECANQELFSLLLIPELNSTNRYIDPDIQEPYGLGIHSTLPSHQRDASEII